MGCASSGMTSERASQIPDGASAVVLHSDAAPDSLYQSAYQLLRRKGLQVAESNNEMQSLTTAPGPLPTSKQQARIDILVEKNGPGSRLIARADTQIGGFGWMDASMAGRGSQARVVFEELVLLMEALPHQKMRYQQ